MRNVTTILVLCILNSLAGYAQTTSGSIAGGVVDAQHSAVPNAVVTATEQEQTITEFPHAHLPDPQRRLER